MDSVAQREHLMDEGSPYGISQIKLRPNSSDLPEIRPRRAASYGESVPWLELTGAQPRWQAAKNFV